MKGKLSLIIILTIFILAIGNIQAQTSGFTYQGRFTDSSQAQPTNGTYQMEFALFDTVAGGTQIGATINNPTVQVTNGIFTVSLDFGANSFDGAARFLEISVFSPTMSAFVNLTPRQTITSAPYSIRSQNAANSEQLGGIDADQFIQEGDTRLTDARESSSIDFNSATINGVVPVGSGGTGSATQNFVDLSTTQTGIGGNKTFTGTISAINVGIGTGSPSSRLDVRGNSTILGNVGIGTLTPAVPLHVIGNSLFLGQVTLGTVSLPTARLNIFGNSVVSGNIGIGINTVSTPEAKLHILHRPIISDPWSIHLQNPFQSTFRAGMRFSDQGFFEISNNILASNPNLARLDSNGNWSAASDIRLKQDIFSISGLLDKTLRLRPVSYSFKSNPEIPQIGFIAQEVERIFPEFVTGGEDAEAIKTLNYAGLSVIAIGAIQEQQKQIDEQKTEIELLKNQNQNQQIIISKLLRLVCSDIPDAEICKETK